jgi:hypothetical protein
VLCFKDRIIGNIATTRFASAFDLFIKKVPLYSTIKDIVDIFNKKPCSAVLNSFLNITFSPL